MQLLQAGHLAQPLRATYARLLVDEYQDCNVVQHAIVSGLAQVLPTCVLGDPMQAIFSFRGNRRWCIGRMRCNPCFPQRES